MWCLLMFPLFIALGIQAIRKPRHRVRSLLEGAIIIIIVIIIITQVDFTGVPKFWCIFSIIIIIVFMIIIILIITFTDTLFRLCWRDWVLCPA